MTEARLQVHHVDAQFDPHAALPCHPKVAAPHPVALRLRELHHQWEAGGRGSRACHYDAVAADQPLISLPLT